VSDRVYVVFVLGILILAVVARDPSVSAALYGFTMGALFRVTTMPKERL
jgi:hypothetical protein